MATIRSLPLFMPENTEQVIDVLVPWYVSENKTAPLANLPLASKKPKEHKALSGKAFPPL